MAALSREPKVSIVIAAIRQPVEALRQHQEVLVANHPVKSPSVTTSGPAVIIAYWWGDAGASGDKVAVPNNGFTVLESIGASGSLVQCFVAAKTVSGAGTYDVTWTSTPAQGAQLWMVAVQ